MIKSAIVATCFVLIIAFIVLWISLRVVDEKQTERVKNDTANITSFESRIKTHRNMLRVLEDVSHEMASREC